MESESNTVLLRSCFVGSSKAEIWAEFEVVMVLTLDIVAGIAPAERLFDGMGGAGIKLKEEGAVVATGGS